MALTTTALNEACDAVAVNTIKLHSGDPGAAGTQNVIGSAQATVAFSAAAAGVRTMTAAVDINVPSGTVSHYSLWQGAVLKARDPFPVAETYASPGIAKINSATLTIANVV